jgi:acetylornithine deacetylase/succinyl-diaminopimelate desuccinylase-like protein
MTAIEQIKKEVLASIDYRADEAVSVFREFVRIPSIYKDVSALRRSSEFIADQLTSSGVQAELVDSGSPGKLSVLGRIPGRRPDAGRSLILNGHMDIYPPGKSWTLDPFVGVVKDGRIYGQGTDDMKAGIVAMTLATCFLAKHGIHLCGDLYLHAIPNHYNGGDGTRTALNSGLRADYAIVGEPTDMKVAVAQCGILYVNVTVTGVSTHVSSQNLGVHPIAHAARLMAALKEIQFPSPETDPHGGSCHLNISAVHAEGLHRSLVPDDCTFTGDVRFTPTLGREGAYRAVEQVVENYARWSLLLIRPACGIQGMLRLYRRTPRSLEPWHARPRKYLADLAKRSAIRRGPIPPFLTIWVSRRSRSGQGRPRVIGRMNSWKSRTTLMP